jgi:hypothetical protein
VSLSNSFPVSACVCISFSLSVYLSWLSGCKQHPLRTL